MCGCADRDRQGRRARKAVSSAAGDLASSSRPMALRTVGAVPGRRRGARTARQVTTKASPPGERPTGVAGVRVPSRRQSACCASADRGASVIATADHAGSEMVPGMARRAARRSTLAKLVVAEVGQRQRPGSRRCSRTPTAPRRSTPPTLTSTRVGDAAAWRTRSRACGWREQLHEVARGTFNAGRDRVAGAQR